MINSSELRLGNLVMYQSNADHIVRITSIGGKTTLNQYFVNVDKAGNHHLPDEHLTPIPITTEILSACGFEYNYYDGYTFQHPKGLSYTQPNMKEVNYRGGWIPCQYVHQLQNLHHSLFGEELIVKI